MRPDEIRQIAAWLAATDIDELELRGPAQALRLRRDGAEVTEADEDGAPPAEPAPAAASEHTVAAPGPGVFLLRHPLRDADLASVGDALSAGQPIGLLQVGPLLLPVAAPADAQLLEVLAAHGEAVGYGTPLFALQPFSAS